MCASSRIRDQRKGIELPTSPPLVNPFLYGRTYHYRTFQIAILIGMALGPSAKVKAWYIGPSKVRD